MIYYTINSGVSAIVNNEYRNYGSRPLLIIAGNVLSVSIADSRLTIHDVLDIWTF
jgi:hypothetical protein